MIPFMVSLDSRVDWDDDDPTWRASFPTLTAYIYVNHWMVVLKADKNAASVELNDEWSEEEKPLLLISLDPSTSPLLHSPPALPPP